MESTISKMLSRYELGKISRRELIQALALISAAGASGEAGIVKATSLDHLALQVKDMQRSRDFYVNVFGATENRNPRPSTSLRVDFPSGGLLTLQQSSVGGQIDHFGIKIENFDKDTVTKQLKDRGITPIELPATDPGGAAGFHILDPDGFRVQMV